MEGWRRCVVQAPGATIDGGAPIAAVKQLIDTYDAPQSVVVVEELPEKSTGKIRGNVVRERCALHYGDSHG